MDNVQPKIWLSNEWGYDLHAAWRRFWFKLNDIYLTSKKMSQNKLIQKTKLSLMEQELW